MGVTMTARGNRIVGLIGRYQAKIDALGGDDGIGLNGEPLAGMHDDQKLELSEFLTFQNLQAVAHAGGKLSSAEAMTIYRALGGEVYQGDWPTGTTLATKVAMVQILSELMGIYRTA
jgi:hypothetical protein